MLIVRVENRDQGSVICERCQLATSTWHRLKGLLLSGPLERTHGLLIIPCRAIHTYFMRYAIDVAFLDGECRIICEREQVPPFSIYRPRHSGATMALELAPGRLAEMKTKVGDRLCFTVIEWV